MFGGCVFNRQSLFLLVLSALLFLVPCSLICRKQMSFGDGVVFKRALITKQNRKEANPVFKFQFAIYDVVSWKRQSLMLITLYLDLQLEIDRLCRYFNTKILFLWSHSSITWVWIGCFLSWYPWYSVAANKEASEICVTKEEF
jgi:hypothetical protein